MGKAIKSPDQGTLSGHQVLIMGMAVTERKTGHMSPQGVGSAALILGFIPSADTAEHLENDRKFNFKAMDLHFHLSSIQVALRPQTEYRFA